MLDRDICWSRCCRLCCDKDYPQRKIMLTVMMSDACGAVGKFAKTWNEIFLWRTFCIEHVRKVTNKWVDLHLENNCKTCGNWSEKCIFYSGNKSAFLLEMPYLDDTKPISLLLLHSLFPLDVYRLHILHWLHILQWSHLFDRLLFLWQWWEGGVRQMFSTHREERLTRTLFSRY